MMSGGSSSSRPQQLRLTDYLRPVFHEATLIREYCKFATIQVSPDSTLEKALSGLYVIPSAQSVYVWFGLLTLPETTTPYPSAFIRFHINFPQPDSNEQTPSIYLAPIHPSSCRYITTHPDINHTTGQFTTNKTQSTTYKLLKNFRKSFYKFESDDPEYLTKTNQEARMTVNNVGEIDAWVTRVFKNDRNLILLSSKGENEVPRNKREKKHIGLSFMK